jgi:hypothetical protein
MRVRTKWSAGVAGFVLGVLGLCVLAPVQSALARRPRSCNRQARGATVNKRTSMVVVYTRGSKTFGCWRPSRRTIRLYRTGQDEASTDGVLERVVVNGRFVLAYSQADGEDFTTDRFRLYDLSHRRLSYVADAGPLMAPLPRNTVGAIALTNAGVVAWGLEHVDGGCLPSDTGCTRVRNVLTASVRGVRQLDQDAGFDIDSVQIVGNSVIWRRGEVPHTAPLP